MVHFNASVDIKAEPNKVFSMVEDVEHRTRLNPGIWVLGVVKETNGPVDVGTVFLLRLIIEGKIVEHRSRCTIFVPGRVMETVSDTNPPFQVRVTVEPIPGGTRLIQEESFSLPLLRVPLPKANGLLGKLLRLIFGGADEIKQDPKSLAADEAEMETNLQQRLSVWLHSIQKHVERQLNTLHA